MDFSHPKNVQHATNLLGGAIELVAETFTTRFGALPKFRFQRAPEPQFSTEGAGMLVDSHSDGVPQIKHTRAATDILEHPRNAAHLFELAAHELTHVLHEQATLAALGLTATEAAMWSRQLENGHRVSRDHYSAWSEGVAELTSLVILNDLLSDMTPLVRLSKLVFGRAPKQELLEATWSQMGRSISLCLMRLHRYSYLPRPHLRYLHLPFEVPRQAEAYTWAYIGQNDDCSSYTVMYARGLALCGAVLQSGTSLKQLMITPMSDFQLRRRARGLLPSPLALAPIS